MAEKNASYQPREGEVALASLPPGVAASPQFIHIDVAGQQGGSAASFSPPNYISQGLMPAEGVRGPSSSAAEAAQPNLNQPIEAQGVPVAASYAAIPPSYFGMQPYNPTGQNGIINNNNNNPPYYASAAPPGYATTVGIYGQGAQSIPVAVPLNMPPGGGYGGGAIIAPNGGYPANGAMYAGNGGVVGVQMGQPMSPVPAARPVPGQPGHLPVTGQWKDHWIDCFNACGICCLSWLFPPLRWAHNIERSNFATFNYAFLLFFVPWALFVAFYIATQFTGRASGWLGLLAFLSYCIMISIGTRYRSRLRAKYQIIGSECEDCLLHTCCKPCAISQEARHVDSDLGLPLY